jgi:phosphatidate cytidylyltransferase
LMAHRSSGEAWGRIAVAAVSIPLLYLAVRYGSRGLFITLVGAVILISQIEFYRMAFGNRVPAVAYVSILAGAGVVAALVRWDAVNLQLLLTSAVMGFLIFLLAIRQDCFRFLGRGMTLALGILYIGWLPAHLVLLRDLFDGSRLVIFLLAITWGVDAGAYAVGTAFGKRKLAPVISPKKTIEGAVGGVAVGVLIAWGAGRWFFGSFSAVDVGIVGLGLGIVGQFGDLIESRFKRSAGVKDSSGLIPSHGGLLDKIDSLMFNAPLLYYYMVLMKGTSGLILRI